MDEGDEPRPPLRPLPQQQQTHPRTAAPLLRGSKQDAAAISTTRAVATPVSLPPLVHAAVRGELALTVGPITWQQPHGATAPPRAAVVRIAWWGDASGGVAVPLAQGRAATALFPVVVGPKLLTRYLRNAGALALTLAEAAAPGARVLGTASLALADARATALPSASLPVLAPGREQRVLGRIDVTLSASFGGAAGGRSRPGIATAAAEAAAPEAAAAAHGMAASQAEQLGDVAPAAAAASDAHWHEETAAAEEPAGLDSVIAAAHAAASQEDEAGDDIGASDVGAAATAAGPTAEDDAAAQVILKAERLKAAMDAAIARGLGPALGLGGGGGGVLGAAIAGLGEPSLSGLLSGIALPWSVGDSGSGSYTDGSGSEMGSGSSRTDEYDDDGSGSSSSGLSGAGVLDELEDLLLSELAPARPARPRRKQRARRRSHRATGAGGGGAESAAAAAATTAAATLPLPAQPPATLVVALLGASGVCAPGDAQGVPCGLTARVRIAGSSTAAEAALPWSGAAASSNGGASGAAGPVVELQVDAAAAAAPSALSVELWGPAAGVSPPPPTHRSYQQQLLGVARVPLAGHPSAWAQQQQQQQQQQQAPPDAPVLLASGGFPVWDVLRGRANGAVELACTLLPPLGAGALALALAPPTVAAAAAATAAYGSSEPPAAALGAPAGVLHRFDVSVRSAAGLPGARALLDAGAAAPDARFVGYRFPGEPEPLYTGLVPCGDGDGDSTAVFAASARHALLLPPGASIADQLDGGGGGSGRTGAALIFEVFDKWADDSDTLVASAELPLGELAALAAAAADEDGAARAFLLPLAFDPRSGEAAVLAAKRRVGGRSGGGGGSGGAVLRVHVEYSSAPCYTAASAGGDSADADDDGDDDGAWCGDAGGDDRLPDAAAAPPPAAPRPAREPAVGDGGGRASGLQAAVREAQAPVPAAAAAVPAKRGDEACGGGDDASLPRAPQPPPSPPLLPPPQATLSLPAALMLPPAMPAPQPLLLSAQGHRPRSSNSSSYGIPPRMDSGNSHSSAAGVVAAAAAAASPRPAAIAAAADNVRFVIDRALNLELPELMPGQSAACYVRYEFPATDASAGRAPLTGYSPLAPAAPAPCGGGVSSGAVWLSHRLLPADRVVAAAAADAGAAASSSSRPLLILQLWRRAFDARAAAADLPPLHAAVPAAPAAGDALVGAAAVDLSVLRALGALDGYYAVVDAARRERGQLKVEVALVPSLARSATAAVTPATAAHEPRPASAASSSYLSARDGGGSRPASSAYNEEPLLASSAGDAGIIGGGAGGTAPSSSDALMAALRTNLEELDALSARLLAKLHTSSETPSLHSSPFKGVASDQQQQEQEHPSVPPPPHQPPQPPAAMQALRTCSDDEDYAVCGGASASSADTDELLGQVDWTLPDGSDEKLERRGAITRHAPPAQQQGGAAAAAAAAAPRPSNLDPQEWMFSITAPRRGGGAGGRGAAPVNPGVAPAAAPAAPAAARAQAPASHPAAPVQQQQQQQQQQGGPVPTAAADARPAPPLPGDLDARLDALLADFAPRRRRASSDSDDGLAGIERVALAAPASPPAAARGRGGAGAAASAPRVRFANTLPPPQDDGPLEYSDAPTSWGRRSGGGGATPAATSAAAAPSGVTPAAGDTQQQQQQPSQGGGGNGSLAPGGWQMRTVTSSRAASAGADDAFSIRRRPASAAPLLAQPRARHPAMG